MDTTVSVTVTDTVSVTDTDKEKEKKEKENKIIKTYEEEIGLLSPAAAEQLFNYLDTFSEDVIVLAIKKASLSNKRSINYIKGILNSWDRKNLRTVLDIEREEEEFESRKGGQDTTLSREELIEEVKKDMEANKELWS